MIKRDYFYSGYIVRQNVKGDGFDGIISVSSWLPNPLKAWRRARKDIAEASNAYTNGQTVIIKTMTRI